MDEETLYRVMEIVNDRIRGAKEVKERYDAGSIEYRKANDRHAELRGLRDEIAYEFFDKVDWEYVERDIGFMDRVEKSGEERTSDTVEIELHPEEVGALRGAVEVYRQRFLPAGSDTAKDQALETLLNSVHGKLQDLDLPDEESVEASKADNTS